MKYILAILLAVAAIAAFVRLGIVLRRRRGYSSDGFDSIVRCSEGHLFTTIWVPGVSFKSLRLGRTRYQHCPVGDHWTRVEQVRPSDLSDQERQLAGERHDVHIP